MIDTATTTSHAAPSREPFEGASLPPVREWLATLELAKEGLYLSPILEIPRLFISDVASAGSSALLSQNKIGAILSLVPQPFERMILSEIQSSSLERYRVLRSTHGPYNDPNVARYHISLRDDGSNTPQQLIAVILRECPARFSMFAYQTTHIKTISRQPISFLKASTNSSQ